MLPNQLKRLCLLVLILSFYIIPTSLAQHTQSIDSLIKLVIPSNPDSVNGKIYYDLARKYYASDTKKALVWAKEGAKYFERINDYALMTRCMNIEAVCLFILDRHEESIKLHYKILKIREDQKDTLGIAETFLNIGNVYYRGGDLEQSVKFYIKSREYALKKNNTKLLSSLANNIGNYYNDKYTKTKSIFYKNQAIKYLKEAVYYKEKLKLDLNIGNTYTTLSKVYFESKDYEAALKYAKKAETAALKSKNDEAVASSKMLLCELAIINKDAEKAEQILDGLYSYIGQQKAFHVLNMFDEEIVIKRNKIRYLRSTLSEDVDENTVNITDTIKDNDYNNLLLSRQKIREELNIKYETEKKELENINLALKNKVAQNKIEKIKILSVISLLFTVALLFLIVKLKKKNKKILKSEISIKKQAEQLYQQNRLLKQSEAFKAKIFSIISHDLRSPLNSLRMTIQMASDYNLPQDDQNYLMDNIQRELDVTSNLLDDLLFWSTVQMKSNSVKWAYFNLYHVVSKCLTTLSSSVKLKQLKIDNRLSDNFVINGDEMRCEFVIRNILHNAIKYSEVDKTIEIGIKDGGENWDFYIKDFGIGISQEQLDKMFSKESSPKSTPGTCKEQGAGIGLLLCHDFIESLGWSLFVESEIGHGTTFHIFILKNDSDSNLIEDNTKEDQSELQLQ